MHQGPVKSERSILVQEHGHGCGRDDLGNAGQVIHSRRDNKRRLRIVSKSANPIERDYLTLCQHAKNGARECLFPDGLVQNRVSLGKPKALRRSRSGDGYERGRHTQIGFGLDYASSPQTNPTEGAPDRAQDPSILKHRGLQGMSIQSRLVAIGLVAGMVSIHALAQQGSTQAPAAVPQPAAAAPTYTVPAGTKILLSLKNGINTKTAQQGDGVYLVSSFPVVGNSRVMVPVGVYVQGVVDRVQRPGRVKGRAQLDLHFTTMIFPNGQVVEVPGVLNSLPGSDGPKVKGSEGTVEQAGNKGRDVGNVLKGAAIGAEGGVLGGAATGNVAKGVGYGGLAGAAAGTIYTLFTRGNDIVIPSGTSVEMVLQRSLILQESQLAGADESRGQAQMAPAGQRQPMAKPRQRILCPFGSPGCN